MASSSFMFKLILYIKMHLFIDLQIKREEKEE